jgi:uncharacterized protein (TIGR03000 family)
MSRTAAVVLGLLLMAAQASRVEGQMSTARLSIRVPAEARLWIDDTLTPPRGEVRIFETPPLEPGFEYRYTLRAELGTVRATRTVSFRAGSNINVDLSAEFARADPAPGGKPAAETTKASEQLTGAEQEVLELTNQERDKAGLPRLRSHAKLARAAREHSANMARLGQLAHTLEGKGPAERLAELGYQSFGWGENVAGGQRTPQEALQSWMNSPGHRGNILSSDFTEIGVGIAGNNQGGFYFTQVFARPAGN